MNEQQQGAGEGLFVQWMKAWSRASEQASQNTMVQQGQELFKQWQDMARKGLEELVRSEGFLGQMGKNMEFGHLIKSQLDELLERQLTALHLPSTGDLQEVHSRLRKLEDRVELLLDRVEELGARLPATSTAPPATTAARAPEASPVEQAPPAAASDGASDEAAAKKGRGGRKAD